MAKVMIGVPMHAGGVSFATMDSVSQASSKIHTVNYKTTGLSLLAKNFNMLFIDAYTRGYDYFILLHSDIGVAGIIDASGKTADYEGSWVDLLVERMEEVPGVASISAVVPIKSPDYLTSTAIELDSGDPYSIRRMTVKESNKMPLIFGRQEMIKGLGIGNCVGYEPGAFLPNTGLMIMDLKNIPWAELKWPGFGIKDTIEWSRGGVPQSFCQPEDWQFGRWVHYETDYEALVTRELIIVHVGSQTFLNNADLGKEQDNPPQQMSIEDYRESQ